MGTVLLIEADDGDAAMMKALFEGAGHQTVRATEGQAGIDLARTMAPDLIMLAVELPGTSGYKACRDLKQDADLKSIPLVITSSTATEDTFAQHRTFKTRADDYLHKPLDTDVLTQSVSSWISLDGGDEDDELLFAPVDDDDDDEVMFAEPDLDEGIEVGDDDAVEMMDVGDDDMEMMDVGDDHELDMMDVGDDLDLSGMLDEIEVGSEIMDLPDEIEMMEEVGDAPLSDLVDVVEVTDAEPEAAPTPPPPASAPAVSAAPPSAPPPAPISRPSAPSLATVPRPTSATLAPPAVDSAELDALRAENASLESELASVRAELESVRAELAAAASGNDEVDMLKAKITAAREALAQLRIDYFQTVTTISTVLAEKATELEAYGALPRGDE